MPPCARSPHRPARARARPLAAGLLALGAALLAPGAPTAAAPATSGPTLLVRGAGDGHGVGMSQEGALGYAQHGYGYTQILAHYYTATAIGHIPTATTVRVMIGGHVKRMNIETYVRGVVGAEMPGDWPAAALEAQAVASRTYALTDHAGGARFDVYADTRSQVYLGARAQTAATNSAVAATAGQIVTYQGQPAITYFFASSGGATESVQNGFPGAAPEPWLVGVPDPYDQGPLHSWSLSMSFASAGRRLRGLYRGRFRGIEVLRRGYSPRIVAARVLGSRGDDEVTGPELEERLGLDSTWAYFSVRTAAGVQAEPDLSHTAPPPGSGEAGGTGTGASPGPAGPSPGPAGGTGAE
ncbi:MAG TPA: SpoIID/LytB domain-containing protein [Solirubrobacteraceae bacterium]|nr:SpoIID/LytB domain-containing protein [Solirubrobacteraceae bacterium]